MSPGKKPRIKKPSPPPTPKTPQPWDPLPHTKTGDPTSDVTYAAVGHALSAWEDLEHGMSLLFAGFLGLAQSSLPASRAYGSVLTFRGRADMIEAAAEAYFFEQPEPSLQKEVASILKQARGFSARRNEIAHGIVRPLVQPMGSLFAYHASVSAQKWSFAIFPSDYATNKTDLAPGPHLLQTTQYISRYAYSSSEIGIYADRFATLAKQVRETWISIIRRALAKRS